MPSMWVPPQPGQLVTGRPRNDGRSSKFYGKPRDDGKSSKSNGPVQCNGRSSKYSTRLRQRRKKFEVGIKVRAAWLAPTVGGRASDGSTARSRLGDELRGIKHGTLQIGRRAREATLGALRRGRPSGAGCNSEDAPESATHGETDLETSCGAGD